MAFKSREEKAQQEGISSYYSKFLSFLSQKDRLSLLTNGYHTPPNRQKENEKEETFDSAKYLSTKVRISLILECFSLHD